MNTFPRGKVVLIIMQRATDAEQMKCVRYAFIYFRRRYTVVPFVLLTPFLFFLG